MNTISIIIGCVALIGAGVAFLPLLGSLNWLVIGVAIIGAGLGMISKENSGQNINLFVIIVALFRLFLGGGCV